MFYKMHVFSHHMRKCALKETGIFGAASQLCQQYLSVPARRDTRFARSAGSKVGVEQRLQMPAIVSLTETYFGRFRYQ
jgi:hypothetical protein